MSQFGQTLGQQIPARYGHNYKQVFGDLQPYQDTNIDAARKIALKTQLETKLEKRNPDGTNPFGVNNKGGQIRELRKIEGLLAGFLTESKKSIETQTDHRLVKNVSNTGTQSETNKQYESGAQTFEINGVERGDDDTITVFGNDNTKMTYKLKTDLRNGKTVYSLDGSNYFTIQTIIKRIKENSKSGFYEPVVGQKTKAQ